MAILVQHGLLKKDTSRFSRCFWPTKLTCMRLLKLSSQFYHLNFVLFLKIERKNLRDVGFTKWTHRDTFIASGQQSWFACGWPSNRHSFIVSVIFCYWIGGMDLYNNCFTKRTLRDTRSASGQQSWRACGWPSNHHNFIVWIFTLLLK